MGIGDKIKNSAQDAQGKMKEKAGDAKDDDSMKTEGQADQSEASVKKAGENVKDAFSS